MGSTDPGGARPAVPVENTLRALRRLAPGAALRTPRGPDLRLLARALRSNSPASLARTHAGPVSRVVLAKQLRALDRAMTGLFAPDPGCPEAVRLVRAARYSRTRRAGPALGRLRTEPGLRAAVLAWTEVTGYRLLAAELSGTPPRPDAGDGWTAAELAVAAVLPRADVGERGREVLVPRGAPGPGAFLDVRSVRVGERGFRVGVRADPPVDLVRDGEDLTLRALWWNGFGRVTDDLGHEYLVLAKDPAATGLVRHWCHPRPAPGARVLHLESAGYRGERLRLTPAARGSSAEVLVKLELTVRLGT
ncbi:hypothetical protein M8542_49365 [Amycolatopsis sp. OK19-0408]|uniref:Uncharacterized protein n=1 Tax=Amycolatopsis iheyensis TaxID=2945988 RepID=A0A9X2SR85_9PSEU|nr:hypothetical protein [Amycolatopsis iheyensis]MCR6490823.1 hypothetical protein [Amycolatopsis iheyensis]